MSNPPSDSNTSRPASQGSGIRLPPISFLGNLNNPRRSPTPQAQNQAQNQGPPSASTSTAPSQMGLGHLIQPSQNSTPETSQTSGVSGNAAAQQAQASNSGPGQHSRDNSSGFQLPPLTDSRLPSIESSSNPDDKRSIYNLPTPVALGIDVRKQNLGSESTTTSQQQQADTVTSQQQQQQQQQQHQQQQQQQQIQEQEQARAQREEDELREKRLKEERKRKNRERREREKALKQQQQMLQDQQNEFERRRVLEENEQADNNGPYYSDNQRASGSPQYLQPEAAHPQLHQKRSHDDTQEEEELSVPFKRQIMTINNTSVLQDAEAFPRSHIGTILYQQYPTRDTVVRSLRLTADHEQRLEEEERDYEKYVFENRHYLKNKPPKIINLLPPYLKFYINCLVDVKISYKDLLENENVYKRNIWGSDIYTDDSDIVGILYHCGVIPSRSPFGDRDGQHQQVKELEKTDEAQDHADAAVTAGNQLNNSSVQELRPSSLKEEGADLIVTLVILPALVRYQGSFRNNYNSRSWLGTHDGGSIALYNVKWCHLGDSYKSNNSAAIKRIALTDVALMKHQMKEDAKYADQLKEDGVAPGDPKAASERVLSSWNFDKSYLNSNQERVRKAVNAEYDARDKEKDHNDTTILLANQTTQIQHTDDTTIPEITKHDDTTIDDHA